MPGLGDIRQIMGRFTP